ncbi:MAG TPA: hypothetical protein VK990_07385 [Acidimicrobiia bacterium]|nr:hypothetical protein [Acidimicrobiia bacterium]
MTQSNAAPSPSRLSKAQDRRRLLAEEMRDLEKIVAGPASAHDWLDRVETGLSDLRQALDAHIAEVEGPDGLLAEIVEMAPRLSAQTDQLREDHMELLGAWLRAEATVRAARGDGADLRALIRRRVVNLIGHLTMHRQAGSDLVFEAYNVDIAASD